MKLMFSIFFIQNLDLFSYILENWFFFSFLYYTPYTYILHDLDSPTFKIFCKEA